MAGLRAFQRWRGQSSLWLKVARRNQATLGKALFADRLGASGSKRYRNHAGVATDLGPARSRSMNRARKHSYSRTHSAFETLSKTTLEARLVQAYVMLLVVPKDKHDLKFVSVARYGAYEVRLVDPPLAAGSFAFWLELFDRDCQISIDGGGSNDFEQALATAEYFVSCAKKLSRGNIEK